MNPDEEKNLLNISQKSLYSAGVMQVANSYCFRILKRHLREGNLLEMGPAEGVMTEPMASLGRPMTVVEGSSLFCDSLRQRYPQVRVVHSLFEKFEPEEHFDNIILGHVLEHVENPVDILTRVRSWLRPGSCVFAAVPNSRSLHRQAAVIMGLLPTEDALNELDLHHGHRRVFNPESFRSVFTQAGLHVDIFGGYYLKPISNGQIENHWTPEMIDAFMQMGSAIRTLQGKSTSLRLRRKSPSRRGNR